MKPKKLHLTAAGCLILYLPVVLSSIINRKMNLMEEAEPGTKVANVADILEAKLNNNDKKHFKILSQKLVTSKVTGKKSHNEKKKWLSIEPSTGELKWINKFDREAECPGSVKCILRVQAVLMPQAYFALLNLDISIGDLNDVSPTFRSHLPKINVSESMSVGSEINIDGYKARDADHGNNSVIDYILEANKYFKLKRRVDEMGESHLFLILLNELDYEAQESHQITLTARDRGVPTNEAKQLISISVVDENDHEPVFLHDEYAITLQEALVPGHVISQVRAMDEDSGSFGRVTYHFSERGESSSDEWRDLVALNNITGEITLLEELDREKHDGIRIPIMAMDGDPVKPKIGHTWLVIHVNDVNDNDPKISVKLIVDSDGDKAFISESSPVGSYLAYVITTDPDGGENGKVRTTVQSIVAPGSTKNERNHNVTGQFVLTSEGLIVTGRPLDRETCNAYKIFLEACDFGISPRCKRKIISVVVLDENEHEPLFEAPTQLVTLREDSDVGTFVTSVRARDNDAKNGPAFRKTKDGKIETSHDGEVSYKIIGRGGNMFQIDSHNGKILLKRKLDREKQQQWRLSVVATDGGTPKPFQSTCVVIIEIDDVNDNSPVFVNPSVNNTVLQVTTEEISHSITKIKASDSDQGENGRVTYYIKSETSNRVFVNPGQNKTNVFAIHSTTGELTLARNPQNKTEIVGDHTLIIEARDAGELPRSSFIRLQVQILEAHRYPTTSQPTYGTSSTDFLVLVVSLGTSTVLLLIAVVIVIKCRQKKKRMRTYRCQGQEKDKNKIKAKGSVKSESEEEVKLNVQTPPEKTMSAPGSTKLERSWKPSSNRCDSDSIFSSSNGSNVTNSDVDPYHSTSYHTLPGDRSRLQIITPTANRLCPTLATIRTSESSHPDSDSGKGESETDGLAYDIRGVRGKEVYADYFERNPKRKPLPDDVFQRDPSVPEGMSSRCTQQCLEYGHSDLCWMPINHHRPANKRHHSSPTSGPSVPKFRTYISGANQHSSEMPRLEAINEALPQQRNLPFAKPSSCSDLQGGDINHREILAYASSRMYRGPGNPHSTKSPDMTECNKLGSRTGSSDQLSQVSSSCSNRSGSGQGRHKPHVRINCPDYAAGHQNSLKKSFRTIPGNSFAFSDPHEGEQNATPSTDLITANEAQEIIDDISRLLV